MDWLLYSTVLLYQSTQSTQSAFYLTHSDEGIKEQLGVQYLAKVYFDMQM